MEILRCSECQEYTLEQTHCGTKAHPPKPPKYSVEDKYVNLKRKAKEAQRIEQGLL